MITVHVISFCDASFAIRTDTSKQIYYIIFLSESYERAILVQRKSYIAHHVVLLLFAGGIIMLADMLDTTHTLTTELRRSHSDLPIPLRLFNDSEIIFDIISKNLKSSECRLMAEIADAREAFKFHEI